MKNLFYKPYNKPQITLVTNRFTNVDAVIITKVQ